MGREIKRVPVDFDYPQGQIWQGYINPYWEFHSECPACGGTGYSPEAKRISDQWYGYTAFHPSETGSAPLTPETPAVKAFVERQMQRSPEYYTSYQAEANRLISMWNTQWCHHLEQADVDALLNANRLYDFTRVGRIPTVQEVQAWNIQGMGHDGINHYVCVKAKCERLGIDTTCKACNGDGDKWVSQGHKYLYDQWAETEPPTGDGWQLWENVSEGSPVSPVFPTETAFREWLSSEGYSPTAIDNFIQMGFAFSMVMQNGVIKSNIETMDMED